MGCHMTHRPRARHPLDGGSRIVVCISTDLRSHLMYHSSTLQFVTAPLANALTRACVCVCDCIVHVSLFLLFVITLIIIIVYV